MPWSTPWYAATRNSAPPISVVIKDAAVPAPAAPDADAIETYYKANTAHFMAPEFRALTVLLLRPADVAGDIAVTDDMLQDAYQQRKDEFDTPERREASQVVLSDEATAAKATALVQQGKDLAAIASALGSQVIDLGAVERSELPDELAASVFAQAKGSIAPAVKSPLGWHVVKVTNIIPGHTRTLAEVKGQIEQDIRREKSDEALNDLSTKLQDTFASGASMEEAAQRLHLDVMKFAAVDAQGKGSDGKPVPGLPKPEVFLDVAFHSDTNTESQVTENPGDGYFVVRVDGITPPAPRPLAEVKEAVVRAWTAEKRHALAHDRAEASRQLAAGTAADAVARTLGGEARTTPAFTREHTDTSGLPQALAAGMFTKSVGEVGIDAVQGGWVAARLAEIRPFDPAAHADTVATARRALEQRMSGDLADQFLAALNAKLGVKIDRSQLTHEE